jgi:hypothetical protein
MLLLTTLILCITLVQLGDRLIKHMLILFNLLFTQFYLHSVPYEHVKLPQFIRFAILIRTNVFFAIISFTVLFRRYEIKCI